MVDLDPAKLLAKGLTPLDVANAVNAQNLTLPSGTAKIGDTQVVVTPPVDLEDGSKVQIRSIPHPAKARCPLENFTEIYNS